MKNTIKSTLTSQVFKYLVAGVSATAIYFIIKMLLFSATGSGVISEIIAQGVSILFAFFTNKLWVFEKTSNRLLHEFIKFVISRLLVLLLSVIANWYFVDTHPHLLVSTLHLNLKQSVFVLSLFLQVLTIILNYIFSKFLIFTKK
ncbi:GtrA family protein [Lactococcus piscium]|uniref:GtrA family protein n=1 Tax=Pseudolactococcus carnosus TaxID=2749961 RepID=UPI001FB886BF|nr:GtrA family protein [Lactococcus carnosus]MCJ1996507.1 GtrA family protein [Lactococcus carnosus]